MKRLRLFLFLISLLPVFAGSAQKVDSTLIKKYPFRLGNIGFAIDSLEFIVGNVSRGETFHHELQMYNFGKDPVTFQPGKTSKFVTMNYNPVILSPGQAGTAIIDFEVIWDLPSGPVQTEIAIESNDKKNPYKFLYLVGNIVDDQSQTAGQLIIDTVPRMIFEHYNYDFGHLSRGKNVIHTFVFTNRGSEDLVIDEIKSSDGCLILPPSSTVIPPGSEGKVVVKVRTMGSFGVQHRTVSIKTNDPVNPKITLGIHGSVRQLSPALSDPDFCYQ